MSTKHGFYFRGYSPFGFVIPLLIGKIKENHLIYCVLCKYLIHIKRRMILYVCLMAQCILKFPIYKKRFYILEYILYTKMNDTFFLYFIAQCIIIYPL